MNFLVLQETDWLTRGPHIQHHIFERLSKNKSLKITVLDYDIDKIQRSTSHLIKKEIYHNIDRATKHSNVKIIRTAHIQVPYIRRLSSLITNFFQILKIIRKSRPDIIISYSMSNGLMGLFFAKLLGIPFIFHYIDILHELVPIKHAQDIAKIVTKFILRLSDKTLVYTSLHQNKVISNGAPPERVFILPNGVSLENTIVDEKKFNDLKKKFSITEKDFIIFFMGYLYDFAGLYEIIDYYNSDIKNGNLNIKFLILGDGGIYKTLTNHVKEIGADWVILAGRVPFFDITEYMHMADLCLLSFKINDVTKEITPIKIIEYMAMKKPVLSNRLPGVFYEIGENNGVIFADNQKALIKKIRELILNKGELRKIGQKGFEIVKAKYTWIKIISDFKDVIIELLKEKNKKSQKSK